MGSYSESGAGLRGLAGTPAECPALWYAPGNEHPKPRPNRIKRTHNGSRIFLEEAKVAEENRVNAEAAWARSASVMAAFNRRAKT